MSHLKLYGPKLGSSGRCHWVLEELGVPYEHINLELSKGEHKTPTFLSLNPNGQVPVLQDGDFVLTESLAICDYLAAKYDPKLRGTNPQDEALIWQWSLWGSLNVYRYFSDIAAQKIWIGTNDPSIIGNAEANLPRFLKVLEAKLEGKQYLVSDSFTLADLNMTMAMSYAKFINYDLSAYPNITRWFNEMTSRDSYKKLMS